MNGKVRVLPLQVVLALGLTWALTVIGRQTRKQYRLYLSQGIRFTPTATHNVTAVAATVAQIRRMIRTG